MIGRGLCVALALTVAAAVQAEPATVFAAGSLAAAVGDIVAASGLPAGAVAAPVFGPAGALRERIEAGEPADLLLSADLAGPQRLVDGGRAVLPVVAFARNRMCVAASLSLGLTPGTLLETMLRPDLRLATSTPGKDPGGDYALAVFARAGILRPGAQEALQGKALQLLGNPASMTQAIGHSAAATVFLDGHADMLLYYCSGAAAVAKEVPGITSVPLPPELEPGPVYGLALLSEKPEAMRLALFLVSRDGQAILARAGLLPLLSVPER